MIEGVEIKKLVVHKDKRGFFCELIKKSDSFFKDCRFSQLSHSFCKKGVLKAWHLHKKQTDFIYMVSGKIKLVLYDNRKPSKTHKKLIEINMNDNSDRVIVKIPPGVAHGYKVLKDPTHVIYLMNKTYDSKDEYRIPANDSKIGYQW